MEAPGNGLWLSNIYGSNFGWKRFSVFACFGLLRHSVSLRSTPYLGFSLTIPCIRSPQFLFCSHPKTSTYEHTKSVITTVLDSKSRC